MIVLCVSQEAFDLIFKQLIPIIKNTTEIEDQILNETKQYYSYQNHKKHTLIHRANDPFDYTLFLGKGLIRSFYLTPEGKEITYFFFKENQFVCDFESFLLQSPGKYFFETLENCEFLKISYNDIQKQYGQSMKFQKLGKIIAEQSYLSVEKRLRMFMTQDLLLKYQTMLKDDPVLIERIPQYHLASYLGVSPEALSRIKSKIVK